MTKKRKLPTSPDPLLATYVLAIDGAYYVEALDRYEEAAKIEVEYNSRAAQIKEQQDEIAGIESKYENALEAYDETEGPTIALSHDWEEFAVVGQSFIRSASTVRILCAACLEAHINMRAESTLAGRLFNEFDKLALTGKWLLYPKMLGLGEYKVGAEPYQSFHELVTKRNALLHYKKKIERRRYGYEVPDFIEQIGLRSVDLKRSLNAAAEMIKSLAGMEGRKEPGWLTGEYWAIFDMLSDRGE